MGTRIDVYLSHDLPRFDDAEVTLARLTSTLPAAFAVRDYWRSVDPSGYELERWEAEPVTPRMPNVRRYSGPGSLLPGGYARRCADQHGRSVAAS